MKSHKNINARSSKKVEKVSKYDFEITGKNNTGKCTVDVYRILSALPERLDPEIEHAVKKLLFAGCRGHKDKSADIHEAAISISAYQSRITDEMCNKVADV